MIDHIKTLKLELFKDDNNNKKLLKENFLDRLKLVPYIDLDLICYIGFCFKKKITNKNERKRRLLNTKVNETKINNIWKILKVIDRFIRIQGILYIESKNANKVYKLLTDIYN